ncbi:MAG TPA: multiubiquitin domain-containing protein [Caulobacteraceae bacterium]|jgi:hypothetical protein|nr:multiubiquitin domain-containing protein [Caulobacteraceae bacterium]
MSETGQDIEDIEACVREGRRPRDAGPYRVMLGDALFNFRPILLENPVHTGQDLCGAAALEPPHEHVLFAVQSDGLLEALRMEERFDLREGIEKFLAFRSDRIFRFVINEKDYEWGGVFITGATVLSLAKADPATSGVWLKGADGAAPRRIGPAELVDLSEPGMEQFVTAPMDSPPA